MLGELPPRGDEEGWRSLCFPAGEVEEVVQVGGCRLSPEIVLQIDDPTAAWLLECHVGWLCEDGGGTPCIEQFKIDRSEDRHRPISRRESLEEERIDRSLADLCEGE